MTGKSRRARARARLEHLEGGCALLEVLLSPRAEGAASNLLNLALVDEALPVPLYVGLLQRNKRPVISPWMTGNTGLKA